MARRPVIVPLETASGWMVSTPQSMTADGKRHKRFFSTPTAAEKYAAALRARYAQGIRGGVISHNLAIAAAEAERILEGTGVSLVEAARMARAAVAVDGGEETFAERHARATAANKERWRKRYALDMARVLKWVPSLLPMRCGAIDARVVESAITAGGELARSTIDMRARYISAVLGFRERHHRESEIHILTPARCGRLLRACESAPERRAVALLLFAGIRPDSEHGEISRLTWSAVGAESIYVSRDASKVSDRIIPITPRLRRLLRGHPKDGSVTPPNWKRVWQRLRKSAEITEQDVTRHTFASSFLAAFGEEAAKSAMGHTKGSDTLIRHYRRAVTEEAGKRFFSIRGA